MVALILLYFVGKAFYDLAGEHDKSQWLFAIAGVASYYAGWYIGGVALAISYLVFMDGSIEGVNETVMGLLALPIGVLACWGFYRILKSRWSRIPIPPASDEILDADLIGRSSDNLN